MLFVTRLNCYADLGFASMFCIYNNCVSVMAPALFLSVLLADGANTGMLAEDFPISSMVHNVCRNFHSQHDMSTQCETLCGRTL